MQTLRTIRAPSLLAIRLAVLALALLQCLLPLLHAHPQRGDFRPDDPAQGSIHLPSLVHIGATSEESRRLPDAVTPADDSGRLDADIQPLAAPGAGLVLPASHALHERARDDSAPRSLALRLRLAGLPRAPPPPA